jgi:His/Glu/Gln/Arg/opine family amino acid ABC transporter permease subunit
MAMQGPTEPHIPSDPHVPTRTRTDAAREFPWWIVIILVGLIGALTAIFLNPEMRARYSDAFGFILPGVGLTLLVTVSAYSIALVIGLVIGLMRLSKNPFLSQPARVYVEIMRGLPLLVIVLYAGFVIGPWIRDASGGALNPNMLMRAILGLGMGYGAFLSEVFRSGIQSIGRGQSEAARSLGMNSRQTMTYVILPQAFRIILPPLGNDFVSMVKDSALVSALGVQDITQLGKVYSASTFLFFETYNVVAYLYLVMTISLSLIVRWIEARMKRIRG